MEEKTVMVSGCYDFLHAGHIAFFKTAATYGKLYVIIGQDLNVLELKGKAPYFSQEERCFIVSSVKYVHKALIASGRGMVDFEPDMRRIKPDLFIVNSDGHTTEKEQLCRLLGVEYLVLERIPEKGMPPRSSSGLKKDIQFPYRICIAGGWMDQPWVSQINSGSVVVAQLWPTVEFNHRSGMATSSRDVALELWGGEMPKGDPIRNAQLLFGAENPPNSKYISGSQDQIGLLFPGINNLIYEGDFWPGNIEHCIDPAICDWLSGVLQLIPLDPRPVGFNPLAKRNLIKKYIKALGESGILCWNSILNKDIVGLGKAMTMTFMMWRKILPCTVPDWLMEEMGSKYFPFYPGATTSGSGGGYVVVASEKEIEGAIRIKIRY